MRLRCLLLLLALPLHLSAADHTRLLLAGGALPVCSNVERDVCVEGTDLAPPPSANRYKLDQTGIQRVAAGGWLPARSGARAQALSVLRRWLARVGEHSFAADDLPRALGGDAGVWTSLAAFEQARILDALETAPAAEQVQLADSKPESGASIYRELVAMARASGRERPRVLVSTASSRDPYVAIDFYRDVFAQAGAEVRWLPLDHTLRAARTARDCTRLDYLRGTRGGAHDRDRLYPKRAAELARACADVQQRLRLIRWADAVFLNGGDQSFTRAAWFDDGQPSAELKLLLERVRAGTLVLGGTSAGTAVQSGAVMIVNGPALPTGPALALRALPPDPDCRRARSCAEVDPDALMFHPDGGLGSFTPGLLDTHFSERGREYRLARLLLDTGTDLGVGIDETTGLRLERQGGAWQARVIGRGRVTVLQRIDSHALLRRRHAAGAAFPLLTEASGLRCGAGRLPPVQVSADGPALATLLDQVQLPAPLPLVLVQDRRRVAAGSVCAPMPGVTLWGF